MAVASIPHEIAFSASLGRGWLANCQDGCGTAWNELPRDQVEWHWEHQLCTCPEGLTSEEYRWAPVIDAWSVRPRGTAATSMAAGAGGLGIDWADSEPSPAPFTTIAWRPAHIIVGVLACRRQPAQPRVHVTRSGGSPEHNGLSGEVFELPDEVVLTPAGVDL